MSDKISPGPWKWNDQYSEEHPDPSLLGADGKDILVSCIGHDHYARCYSEADAALVADAPTMLDLLRELGRKGWDHCLCCDCDEKCAGDCKLDALLDKHGRG